MMLESFGAAKYATKNSRLKIHSMHTLTAFIEVRKEAMPPQVMMVKQ